MAHGTTPVERHEIVICFNFKCSRHNACTNLCRDDRACRDRIREQKPEIGGQK
jgi:hypothetical protein